MRAAVAYVTAKAGGDRARDFEDFLPHWDEPLEYRMELRERRARLANLS